MRYVVLVLAIVAFVPAQALEPASDIKLDLSHPNGVTQYRLDHATKVTGWRVAKDWYFGRQRGSDSGLTLVWQSKQNQLSLSKDGIRLTRRF